MSSDTPATTPVAPHLIVDGAAEAIDFYKAAFGAVEVQRNVAEDGTRLMHAAITINDGLVMLMDDFSESRGGTPSDPKALGGSPVVLHLSLPDVDATWAQAVEAGATVTMPLEDTFWGDRYGQLTDPFGHVWSLSSPSKES